MVQVGRAAMNYSVIAFAIVVRQHSLPVLLLTRSARIVASWFIARQEAVVDRAVVQVAAVLLHPRRSCSSSMPIELRHKPAQDV